MEDVRVWRGRVCRSVHGTPLRITKYEDTYHIYFLALHVHRAGFEPYTSTFSSRSFFFTYSFCFTHAYVAFFMHMLLFFYPAYIAFFFTYINRVSGSPNYRFPRRKERKTSCIGQLTEILIRILYYLIRIQHTYLV
jgi:hypothetical protein